MGAAPCIEHNATLPAPIQLRRARGTYTTRSSRYFYQRRPRPCGANPPSIDPIRGCLKPAREGDPETPSPPPGPTLPALAEGHHLLDARLLLLLLQRRDLLAAVPPLLLAQLEGLGLELLDEHRLGLLALHAHAVHEDFLPLGGRPDEEVPPGLEWLVIVSWVSRGAGERQFRK